MKKLDVENNVALSLEKDIDFLQIAAQYRRYYNKEDMRSLLSSIRSGNATANETLTKVSINILLDLVSERYGHISCKDAILKRGLEFLIEGQNRYIEKPIQKPYRTFIRNYIYLKLKKEYDETYILSLLYEGEIPFQIGDFLSDDQLKDFFRNMRIFPKGTPHSFQVLIEEYKRGNERARVLLFYSSFEFILTKAKEIKKSTHSSCPLIDLWQEGVIALMNAIEKYDPSHPSKRQFISYLSSTLQKEMVKFITLKYNYLKFDDYIVNIWNAYEKLVMEYREKGLPLPSDRKLKKMLRITPETLSMLKRGVTFEVSSLEDEESYTEDVSLSYELDNLDNLNDFQMMLYFKQRLDPCRYYILYNLAFKGMSKKTMARIFCIPRQNLESLYGQIKNKISRQNFKDGRLLYRLDPETSRSLNKFSVYPVDLELKLSYMFLKDFLSQQEKALLKALAENVYKDDDEVLSAALGMDIEEYRKIRDGLMSKLSILKTDLKCEFDSFKEYMRTKLNQYICNIDFDYDLSYLEEILDDAKLMGINKTYVLK